MSPAFGALLLCLCTCAPGEAPSAPPKPEAPRPEAVRQVVPQPVAPGPAAIVYDLSFPERAHHYVDVEARLSTSEKPDLELFLPSWTPGSYVVRDHARHLEGFKVQTAAGRALSWERTGTGRWRVTAPPRTELVVRYRLYCRTLAPQGNWVDDELALLNGAATFLSHAAARDQPHLVRVELPKDWPSLVTSLEAEGSPLTLTAETYDELADTPLALGQAARYDFSVGSVPHQLATFNESAAWRTSPAVEDLKKLVVQSLVLWGELPYERYAFINAVVETRGALEHARSSVILTDTAAPSTRRRYVDWLRLVAHEYFHAWNGKRLRPREYRRLDYLAAVPAPTLWFTEGLTSYYDALLLRRAGLIDDAEYLAQLSRSFEELSGAPGRAVQTLEESSAEAWTKYYQPNENTPNSSVSYYAKGAVVGFLLDAAIRAHARNKRSLDDVLRVVQERYSSTGFSREDLRAVVQQLGGAHAARLLTLATQTTQEPDLEPALAYFGLAFRAGGRGREAWSGIEAAQSGERWVVRRVLRGTPAYEAGLNVGDELIALDGVRLGPGGLAERQATYRAGQSASLQISRREKVRLLRLTFATAPEPRNQLVFLRPSNAQRRNRSAWLNR